MITGLDLSLTCTGVCPLSPLSREPKLFSIVPPAGLSNAARLRHIVERVDTATGAVIDLRGELVVIESLSFGSIGKLDQLAALSWMVRCSLDRVGTPVLMVAPIQLKKFVCGTTKAEKSQMLLQVYRRWGIELNDDNQADALGLAKIGAVYLGLEECETAAQREVISALKAPNVKKARKRAA